VQTESKLIAAIVGLGGFAVAAVAGVFAENPAWLVLVRAILSMAACYTLGALAASVFRHVYAEFTQAYRSAHPIPQVPSGVGAAESTDSPPRANGEKKVATS
jgi:MFS family permease